MAEPSPFNDPNWSSAPVNQQYNQQPNANVDPWATDAYASQQYGVTPPTAPNSYGSGWPAASPNVTPGWSDPSTFGIQPNTPTQYGANTAPAPYGQTQQYPGWGEQPAYGVAPSSVEPYGGAPAPRESRVAGWAVSKLEQTFGPMTEAERNDFTTGLTAIGGAAARGAGIQGANGQNRPGGWGRAARHPFRAINRARLATGNAMIAFGESPDPNLPPQNPNSGWGT